MSNSQHSPAPWTIETSISYGYTEIEDIRDADDNSIFLLSVGGSSECSHAQLEIENPADAHLIAAAPELLEALKEVSSALRDLWEKMQKHAPPLHVDKATHDWRWLNAIHAKANAAIARAEGREP